MSKNKFNDSKVSDKPSENMRKKSKFSVWIVIAVLALIALAVSFIPHKNAKQAMSGEMKSEIRADYYADIDIKDYGVITVALNAKMAPISVNNFVDLANSGFYNGLTIHRIIKGFMMQGGDPTGTGMGGSDNTIKGEFSDNGVKNTLSHTRGAISMARSNDPDSASSQFFIVHQDSTFLDGKYACFGYVTEGIDIVDEICDDARPTDNNGTIPAENQPVINSITIRKA